MINKKRIWAALFFGLLFTSMISVYADPGEARNNLREAATRLKDLMDAVNWKTPNANGPHRTPLEIAAHNLWLADQDDNWKKEDPQQPKGPLEKAFIIGIIDGALEAVDKFSKDSEGKPRRLHTDDATNRILQNWVDEIKQKLEAAKKELEKNFYGTPQHLKDALKGVVDEWSRDSRATSGAKQAGKDAQENLCQWDEHKQPDPGATPTPPWTPPKQDGKPVPTKIGGKEEKSPKPRLKKDLQKLLGEIYKKNKNGLRKLPGHCRGGWARPSEADKAIKLIKALRAIARLLSIQFKPMYSTRYCYVSSAPPGGWAEFPGGRPVPTGSPGADIETVMVDSQGPDLKVTIVMNGPIETAAGKEISLLIDTDSDPETGSQKALYRGLGVDASVGLYCTVSSPAAWHLLIWDMVRGEIILREELDSSLFDISDNTAEFSIPDFRNALGIENHYFGWVAMAYEAELVDVVPEDEPVISFIEVGSDQFSLVAPGDIDFDLNEDFARYFEEYIQETENLYRVELGGPAIHEGLWSTYGIRFLTDEGGHYTTMVYGVDEYISTWGEVDYCVLVFEVTQEGITVNIGGITRYGTRAGLHWLMDHWDLVAPPEYVPLVLIVMWVDENEDGSVDADESVEVEVISS